MFGLSTSQWISIIVLGLGIFMLLNRYRFKKKDSFGYRVPFGEVPEGYIYNQYAGAVAPWEQDRLKKIPGQNNLSDAPTNETTDIHEQSHQ